MKKITLLVLALAVLLLISGCAAERVRDTQIKYEALLDEQTALVEKYEDLDVHHTRLQTDYDDLEVRCDNVEARCDDLESQLLELSERVLLLEIESVELRIQLLEYEAANKTEQENESNIVSTEQQPQEPSESQIQIFDSGGTVYITKTGSKYHRDGCSYLKSQIAIDLNVAISQGYTACSRCY